MSILAHPNVHAIGLTVDIIEALRHRLRGRAARIPFSRVLDLVEGDLQHFVVDLSIKLDEAFDNER